MLEPRGGQDVQIFIPRAAGQYGCAPRAWRPFCPPGAGGVTGGAGAAGTSREAAGTSGGAAGTPGDSAEKDKDKKKDKQKDKREAKQQGKKEEKERQKEKEKEKDKEKGENGDDDESHKIDFFTDSDWAGDRGTRRSISGGALFVCGCLISAWSRRQATVALSAAEAELNALTTGLTEAIFARNFISELTGFKPAISVHTDSSAAKAIATRAGVTPRTKHLSIKLSSLKRSSRAAAASF